MSPRAYSSPLKLAGRLLRRNMTWEEETLWARIRRKQIGGVQFYRQRPLGRFVVDFYAPRVKLVTEVDGMHHLSGEQRAYDEARSEYLRRRGLDVVRISNRDIVCRLEEVVERLSGLVRQRR